MNNETDAEDKTVTVLATAANGYGIVNPDGAALTITDDDPAPVVTLVLTPDSIGENSGLTTVTAILDRPSSKPTMVTVSAAAVSPAVTGDFALSTNRTLTIAAGAQTSTGTVTITANGNNVDAPDKEVTVSGTAVNTKDITQPAGETLTIEDDDPPPTVMLSLSKTATDENDSTAITVTASLSHPSSEETTITVSAAAVAPAVASDFALTGDTLTISAGQMASTGTVTIAPVDNETDAPDKTVTVSATVDNTQGYEQGTPADMTLTIRDDDPAPVASLVLTLASIDENGGSTTVTARLDRLSSEDTRIEVSTAAVSPAVAGDFTQTGTMLTIAAGSQDSTGTVTVAAVDNRTDAPDKAVTVSATASNSQGVRRASNAAAGMANVALADAALDIQDDDPEPMVTLHLGVDSIGENDGYTTVTATLSHPSSEATTVTITPAPGDFTLSANGVLTIPAGDEASSGSVTLTAMNDNTDAPDKLRTVLATAVNGQGIVQPAGVALTIEDDEPPPTVTLHLGANSNTIGEDNRSTTVTARLSHPSSEATTVTVSAAAVSPALAADFQITGTVLSILAGATVSGTATIRAVGQRYRRAGQAGDGLGDGGEHSGLRAGDAGRRGVDHRGRRPAADGDAEAVAEFDRGERRRGGGDGGAVAPVERGDGRDGIDGGGEPGGGRRLHADRRAAHGPGRPDGEHRHGDDPRQRQRHRYGEQAGEGFGDGGKRQAAGAGRGREPAECNADHRGRRHARHRAHARDAGPGGRV